MPVVVRALRLSSLALLAVALTGCRDRREQPAPPATAPDAAPPRPEGPLAPLALGEEHACFLNEPGRACCFGRNLDSQLGDGTAQDRAAPVEALGLAGARQLALAAQHSCAVLEGGAVSCWGRNEQGQVGVEGPVVVAEPHRVAGIEGAFQIAVGAGFSCALGRSGQVLCWGRGSGPRPAPVEGLARVRAIVASGPRCCVLTEEGEVSCFLPGQAGPAVGVAALSGASTIALGEAGLCALRGERQVDCLLGGEEGEGGRVERLELDRGGARGLAVGRGLVCLGGPSEPVTCWRMPSGAGEGFEPRALEGSEPVLALALAGRRLCLVGHGGSVACAEAEEARDPASPGGEAPLVLREVVGDRGGCPGAAQRPQAPPSVLPPSSPALALARDFACTLERRGEVACWGRNDQGQLGDGTTLERELPTRSVWGSGDAVEVALDGLRGCLRRAGGQIACWGALGPFNGPEPVRTSRPLPLEGVDDAAALALGGAGVLCVAHEGGSVSCLREGRLSPVEGLGGVVELAAGFDFACARRTGGDVWCWGRGENGQLGQGADQRSDRPVRVQGLSDAVALALGYAHACALRRGGQVLCWGNDEDGELGDRCRGDDVHSSSPVVVTELVDAVAVAAGLNQSCSLLRGGGVRCWGGNTFGQAGGSPSGVEGGLDHLLRPSAPSAAPEAGAGSLACSWFRCCALGEADAPVCWGAVR